MPYLEQLLAMVAPHDCLGCKAEGALLCQSCWNSWLQALPSRCYKCLRLTAARKVCPGCFHKTPLRAVYVRAQYDQAARRLVYSLKFERAQAAALILARYMAEVIPPAFKGIVVPVPTASSRRRQRGYDQAELIARQLAKLCRLRYTKLLRRRGNSRQVGSSRQLRRLQLADAFYLTHPSMVRGQSVLLIDDVLTTGATLEAAGQVVKQAGSKRVMAAVFAQA